MSPSQPDGFTPDDEVTSDLIEVTPEGTQTVEPFTRRRQVIPNDDGRRLRRVLLDFQRRGLTVMMRCEECGAAGRRAIIEATRAEETNELLLVCECTLRICEGIDA